MNKDIEMAIASLCDDIATNTDANDNHKRAEAILTLAFSGIFAPDTEDELDEYEDAPQDPEIAKDAPVAGEHFEYNGIEFVALGYEQGGLLAVMAKPIPEEMPFDKDNCNDWRKSSLRKYLNEEFIKAFDKADLLPFISDLTADDGMRDYGTSEDYIALLSDNLYRKYREYMPKYDTWVWSITPWSCLPGYASGERIVYTSGSVSSTGADVANGVAAACIFNPAIFE